MNKFVDFHNISLRYNDKGEGDTVVLLHGYLESLEIWKDFTKKLSDNYRVITVDLPGHGKSGICSQINTMAIMADAVKRVLDHLGIGRAVIIGHSMGGYATLAFEEIYPEVTIGFALFHSHALPDSGDKKTDRDREIELVKAGKKMQFISASIPNAFASDNLQSFRKEIESSIKIASSTSDEGIMGALEGMKARPDRRHVLKGSTVPVLIIAGKKDNYIPFAVYQEHFDLATDTEVLLLEESGHMGFIEEKEKALEGVINFLQKVYS